MAEDPEAWDIPADAAHVASVRRRVRAYGRRAGLRQPLIDDMALSVSEAVTNAVLHGYPAPRTPGRVFVTVAMTAGGVEVRVADDGVGLRRRDDSPGAGLGLGIIAEVATKLTISASDRGGVDVRMHFATTGR